MSKLTKYLLALWVFLGIPATIFVNLWGRDWWIPFPILQGEDTSYYIAWAIGVLVIFILPIFLLFSIVNYLVKRSIKK